MSIRNANGQDLRAEAEPVPARQYRATMAFHLRMAAEYAKRNRFELAAQAMKAAPAAATIATLSPEARAHLGER